MGSRLIFWKNWLRHKGALCAVFFLVFLVALSLGTVLSLWQNGARYLEQALSQAGFGTLTAWVSKPPPGEALEEELRGLSQVERVEQQPLLFSHYVVGEHHSDSEGQLLPVEKGDTRYRFFQEDFTHSPGGAPEILAGQVYVSPSMVSQFGVKPGDVIRFSLARDGVEQSFTIAGFYEDPFMGSSMIGMKGFLLSPESFGEAVRTVEQAGIQALAREGAMLHIFQKGAASPGALNALVNEGTSLPQYTEFVHSNQAITGFMLVLQQSLGGLLLAFVLVLLLIIPVVIAHSMEAVVEEDKVNMWNLHTLGFTWDKLRFLQWLQYAISMAVGLVLGLVCSAPVSGLVSRVLVTITGLRIPGTVPVALGLGVVAVIFTLLGLFTYWKTGRYSSLGLLKSGARRKEFTTPELAGGGLLALSLALRQLLSGKRRYVGACLMAVLLVFFASLVGRMQAWLGPQGQGMMEAFQPAPHDIGVEIFGTLTREEAESTISSITPITDFYQLAMPTVRISGMDYTANVISQPTRFQLLRGRSCEGEGELVLTEVAVRNLGVDLGDEVTVAGDRGEARFTVTGIYQCANQMSSNLGMSREGYLRIGEDQPGLWCSHYFLGDPEKKEAVMASLNDRYGGDVQVHENAWPGLAGIIQAMQGLLILLYGMVALFIFIVTMMTGSKILSAEKKDFTILQAIGCSKVRLVASFALRFTLVSAAGAALGLFLGLVAADPLVSEIMKLAGISSYRSFPTWESTLLPGGVVVLLFTAFGALSNIRHKTMDLTLLSEKDGGM